MSSQEPENQIDRLESELNNFRTEEITASWNNEKSLRRAIEDAIPSGISIIDDTGKQVYTNKSFCRMVGWEEEELLDKRPPYVYWSQQDLENINKALELTLKNNIPKEGFDLVFCSKTGKLIPVNVMITPLIQENNKTFWLANIIDITERKKAEEALIVSQILLKSSMENQKGTIIFAINQNYHYLFFNKDHSDSMKFAYNKDIKAGMNILDCITAEDDRKLAKKNYDRALGGESFSQIHTFGDTNLAFYESFFNPITNDNGKIIGCTGLARNISERKKAELILKESETKFKEIINQINDGIVVFDEEEKIVVWNNGAVKISGITAEQALNRSIVDVRYQISPPAQRDIELVKKSFSDLINFRDPEAFNKIADSEIVSLNSPKSRNIQSTIFPIRLDGYNLFCSVIRDTTELKRYENELMRISAEKDKFYSLIAQYLYTPFNLFSSFSKLMADELDSLPIKEIQKMAEMMSKSASNLYSLLDNLLQWTKMNQGKINYRPQKLNFLEISQSAVSILYQNAKTKNIIINITTENDISVFADIFMIKTIIRNLVSNAIKYTNNDGHIDVSAQKSPAGVLITVSDDGAGMTPQSLKKLFDISEINSTLDKAEEKGNTLGLILCREFVEKHGGKIWSESAPENGQGVKIKFTLPEYTGQADDI